MRRQTHVREPRPERKYWVQIPNIIDDMGLSPYARTLYLHLKRVAGDDGLCWQSTDTLAEKCCMSTGMVSKAKKELKRHGLIQVTVRKVEGKPYHEISIVDIWPQNMARYAKDPSPSESSPFTM